MASVVAALVMWRRRSDDGDVEVTCRLMPDEPAHGRAVLWLEARWSAGQGPSVPYQKAPDVTIAEAVQLAAAWDLECASKWPVLVDDEAARRCRR